MSVWPSSPGSPPCSPPHVCRAVADVFWLALQTLPSQWPAVLKPWYNSWKTHSSFPTLHSTEALPRGSQCWAAGKGWLWERWGLQTSQHVLWSHTLTSYDHFFSYVFLGSSFNFFKSVSSSLKTKMGIRTRHLQSWYKDYS